jgi:hypothetical protein
MTPIFLEKFKSLKEKSGLEGAEYVNLAQDTNQRRIFMMRY